jgi:signal transduction histidine kinase
LLHDEIYRIGREALVNAFLHASASHIGVDIVTADGCIRLCIRDDGVGISDEVLSAGGRPGHWGLAGMRERALGIGASLQIRSNGGGTEVELRMPCHTGLLRRSLDWLGQRRKRIRVRKSAAAG